jgi:hypothetical protein
MNGKSSILSPWGLFPGPNIQVTDDQKRKDRTSGSRSESDLAVDPKNPRRHDCRIEAFH